MSDSSTKHGWAFPLNCQKAHYISFGRSLCGKWMYLGSSMEQDNHDSPDNCAICKRKRPAFIEAISTTKET